MNTQSKSPLSGMITKVVVAVALVAGALVLLSGLLLNVNKDITVQAEVTTRRSFASLPEYGYIQVHQARAATESKVLPLTGFQALPEYGYIWSHSFAYGEAREPYLPAGLRNLPVYGYIQAHNRSELTEDTFVGDAFLPQGMRTLPVYGYIQAHNRKSSETFVAGLPAGLQKLPEGSYIQVIQDAGSR